MNKDAFFEAAGYPVVDGHLQAFFGANSYVLLTLSGISVKKSNITSSFHSSDPLEAAATIYQFIAARTSKTPRYRITVCPALHERFGIPLLLTDEDKQFT